VTDTERRLLVSIAIGLQEVMYQLADATETSDAGVVRASSWRRRANDLMEGVNELWNEVETNAK
jgi:hypothetical protein